MKQRFSSLDVKVIAHELSSNLVTLRLSNIYDLSSKILLLKFAKPDEKRQMILDSGFRCHLTSFSRTTAAAPSVFVSKLRKYLKTRRVTGVAQVGTDRVIEFTFSDGLYRLFLEFYAAGNVVLTDKELNILALMRVVPQGEGQEELRVGLKYGLENRQNYGGVPPLTKIRLREALQKAAAKEEDGTQFASKKQKKKSADALRKALAVSITEYPPLLVDHAMKVTDFDSSLKPSEVLDSDERINHLLRTLQEAQEVVQQITRSDVTKGYIIAKSREDEPSTETQEVENSRGNLLYEDFHPFRPRQFEDDPTCTILEFDGFNKTVDEFFSSIEGQRLESRLQERELNAKKKIDAARQDQEKRLGGLKDIQTLNERKAGAIEANILRVQEGMDAVNGLVAQGMDWVEIEKLVELEQKKNNPVASIIKLPLKLHENTITLLLGEVEMNDDNDSAYGTDSESSESEDEKEEEVEQPTEDRLSIDINLGLSPWGNAREYYDQKKTAAVKEQKTLQSTTKALKNTEQKINQELKKGLKQEKPVLRPVRQALWFEKFTWFISSDGYLVLGGRDAHQNEILYKKYLRKGDVYVHADLHGASSIVIRNNSSTPDAPIPPSTLSQAGTLAVSSSSAWDSKAGMGAWWVNADQVSKSAPTGEFLPTGSFMVRGKKNFLPPPQLLLGFGVLFQISEESKAKHVKHRLQDGVNDRVERENEHVNNHADANAMEMSQVRDESGDDIEDEAPNAMDKDENNDEEDENDDDEGDELNKDDDSDGRRDNPLLSLKQRPAPSQNGETAGGDPTESTRSKLEQVGLENFTEVASEDKDTPDTTVLEEEEVEEDTSDEEEPVAQPAGRKTTSQTPSKKGPAPLPRGKRGKAKRIAAKYKDQDEEDRLAAQALIGSTLGREKAAAEAAAKEKREAELAVQKERRRAQHQRTLKEAAEHEEVRKLMLEEGIETLDDAEAQRATNLDIFVGTPLPGDEIIDAIPVCAPWNAMGKYKYKVKLQPGSVKKGKAVKEMVGRWIGAADSSAKAKVMDPESRDPERMWPREVELIRGWKVEECFNVVPVGKVRIMMSGGAAGGSAANKGSQGKGKGAGRGKGKR